MKKYSEKLAGERGERKKEGRGRKREGDGGWGEMN